MQLPSLYALVTENHWAVIQFHNVPENDVLWGKKPIPYKWLVGDNMTFYILESSSVYIYVFTVWQWITKTFHELSAA